MAGKQRKRDPSKGLEALLAEMPEVRVGDETRRLRRLGLKDVYDWADILKCAGAKGSRAFADLIRGMDLQNLRINQMQASFTSLLLGLIEEEKAVLGWIAGLVGVTLEEVEDPNVFTLESLADLIEGLLVHPDLEAFFTRVRAIAQNPEMVERISRLFGSAISTGSNTATPGSTTSAS